MYSGDESGIYKRDETSMFIVETHDMEECQTVDLTNCSRWTGGRGDGGTSVKMWNERRNNVAGLWLDFDESTFNFQVIYFRKYWSLDLGEG